MAECRRPAAARRLTAAWPVATVAAVPPVPRYDRRFDAHPCFAPKGLYTAAAAACKPELRPPIEQLNGGKASELGAAAPSIACMMLRGSG